MHAAPLNADDIIANADYQADHKVAKKQMKVREKNLAIMRTNIVATTDPDWERWQQPATATRDRFDNFDIIGILVDHKVSYENEIAQGMTGAIVGVAKIKDIQKEYLEFS